MRRVTFVFMLSLVAGFLCAYLIDLDIRLFTRVSTSITLKNNRTNDSASEDRSMLLDIWNPFKIITSEDDPQMKTTFHVSNRTQLQKAAKDALLECSCSGKETNDDSKISNTVHIVRSSGEPFSFLELVAIKQMLKIQKPDKLYAHSNFFDITTFGNHWKTLNADESLELSTKLRIKGVRMPEELSLFGLNSASQETADLYDKVHVLTKYGGLYFDTNIVITQPLKNLLTEEALMIEFRSKKFLEKGTMFAAARNSTLSEKFLDIIQSSDSDQKDYFKKDVKSAIIENTEGAQLSGIDYSTNITEDDLKKVYAVRIGADKLGSSEESMRASTHFIDQWLVSLWDAK